LQEVNRELENPDIWQEPEKAQVLGQERVRLSTIIDSLSQLVQGLTDASELASLAAVEDDSEGIATIAIDVDQLRRRLEKLEFQRMFAGDMDINHAFMDINAGSGGTEAQDWAEMLLRMYLRWGEANGFNTELIEVSQGDVAGIKSATVKFVGDYAFGWLRTETGVHRLVRKSPFDSGNRRHTSFASVFVAPEVDDDIAINVEASDLRVDTYRASGAGGQHVNKTDSAIRITHLPTGVVVQCQNERSQHKNRAQAMKLLQAKLYELAVQKQAAEKQDIEASKADIGWGSQIRSYVLDQSRIKDLRTGIENTNTSAVLDGALNKFIEASLQAGL